jgi:hypothetical protein
MTRSAAGMEAWRYPSVTVTTATRAVMVMASANWSID